MTRSRFPAFSRERLPLVAPLFALLAAAAFLVISPPVGDLWAARARQSATAHGVGLRYWFSWFGGTVPGHYSVLAPYLTRIADVGVLGALATVAITPLCHRLLRGTRHPALGTWTAAVASSFSLWSGRVPFALGSAVMLIALLCVRADRRIPAAVAGAAAALVSPVSGAFLLLGLTGVFVHDSRRRATSVATAAATGASLIAVALYFGLPGPEGFQPKQATLAGIAIAAMLFTRPPVYLRTVLIISLVACPLVALVPNGMGSNFERFAWICLPVATAATARARWQPTLLVTAFAVSCGITGSLHDLTVAAQPISAGSYYVGLDAELDHTAGLANYRVEVVPDGTHVAAYALLNHAMLARGYETQSDHKFNAVLASPSLDAVSFKIWLDNNAVGYVAINRTTLSHNPENRLIRSGRLAYLTQVWGDAHWQLFKVATPSPVAAPPARVVDADQANLVVAVPRAASIPLRVRWSRFLQVRGPATSGRLVPDGQGWTTLVARRAGDYVITG
jgi:hypothetical protein